MRQLSLLDDHLALSGAMAAVKAAMRRAAGDSEGEGRKLLVDKINVVARQAEIRLTGGNVRDISKDTLDKWLSASDTTHPPSILALLAFCAATGDIGPLRAMARALGMDIMTAEDRQYRDLGKATQELKDARKRLRKIQENLT